MKTVFNGYMMKISLTDRCPFPGRIEDAYWSVTQIDSLKALRYIDEDLLYQFNAEFPGFSRDFIKNEDPELLREHFSRMFIEDNFDMKAFYPPNNDSESNFWDFFIFARERISSKHRLLVNIPLNKTGLNNHLNFKEIKDNLNFGKAKRSSKNKRDLDGDDDVFLDNKFPLHKETIVEQKLNNIFVEFIEKAKNFDFPAKEVQPSTVTQSSISTTKENYNSRATIQDPQLSAVTHASEYLLRESMLNPKWRRTKNYTYFQIDDELIRRLKLSPKKFHEYWIIQKDSESSLHLYSEEKTKVCDRHHFQFKTAPKYHSFNFSEITHGVDIEEQIKQ